MWRTICSCSTNPFPLEQERHHCSPGETQINRSQTLLLHPPYAGALSRTLSWLKMPELWFPCELPSRGPSPPFPWTLSGKTSAMLHFDGPQDPISVKNNFNLIAKPASAGVWVWLPVSCALCFRLCLRPLFFCLSVNYSSWMIDRIQHPPRGNVLLFVCCPI